VTSINHFLVNKSPNHFQVTISPKKPHSKHKIPFKDPALNHFQILRHQPNHIQNKNPFKVPTLKHFQVTNDQNQTTFNTRNSL